MRHVLALFALSVLVPSTALADDDDAQPSSHDTAPTSPTPTIQREFPSQSKPDTSQAVTTEAAAPRAVTSPASTSSDSDEDMGGYVVPHFVPYLGGEIPQYAHIETKPNFGLVAAGAVTLGTPYFISLIYALSTCGA